MKTSILHWQDIIACFDTEGIFFIIFQHFFQSDLDLLKDTGEFFDVVKFLKSLSNPKTSAILTQLLCIFTEVQLYLSQKQVISVREKKPSSQLIGNV